MGWRPNLGFWIELAGSVMALAGMYVGSTTLPGALCYAVSTTMFFWLMFLKKLWGLWPLNVGSAIVVGLNIWRTL